MKKIYSFLCHTVLVLMLLVGVYSLLDKDRLKSDTENRMLKQKPKFSVSALLDGSFISDLESYYSDQFPNRDKLMLVNRSLNEFYSGNSKYNIIKSNGNENGKGENLNNVTNPDAKPTPAATEPADSQEPSPSDEVTEPTSPAATDPEIDTPDSNEVNSTGSLILYGDTAWDVPTVNFDGIDAYAAAVGNLAAALPGVKTYCMGIPMSSEFYTPKEWHTGSHSQKDMIDYLYSKLDRQITTIDAYAEIRKHTDEYLYFRTDHHWTALGAYYAYTAFCQARGFEAVPLSSFETGSYSGFLGSFYRQILNQPQSKQMESNPDTVTYYKPIVESHLTYYEDATLANPGQNLGVISGVGSSVSNKYLCFLGGDHPISIIDTKATGGVCMVIKESYGNAFLPFLTSHYSKIVVVDPRYFNSAGNPSLDLISFAKEMGVNDLLVMNYPYKFNSASFADSLNALVGK